MPTVLLHSARLYAAAFARSLAPGAHPGAPLSRRRALLLGLGAPPFAALQLAHWTGFALDAVFFRAERRTRVERPVFITGIPRSGTTFLHRALARDTAAFTTFGAWEAALAPSVAERRVIRAAAAVDRALGGFGRRGIDALVRRAAGEMADVHAIGPTVPEEDYLALLPAAGCFLLALAFPFEPRFWALARFDEAPAPRLLAFYHRCLQKHLYAEGRGRRLLSKNAAFASWIPALRRQYPDARFLCCVRHPERALSSQLSALAPARRLFAVDPDGDLFARRFLKIFEANLARLRDLATANDAGPLVSIDMDDLRARPVATVAAALERVGERLGSEARAALERANEGAPPPGAHRHSVEATPLRREEIEACLMAPYEEILASPARAAPAPTTSPGDTAAGQD